MQEGGGRWLTPTLAAATAWWETGTSEHVGRRTDPERVQ